MVDTRTQQQWLTRLDRAASALATTSPDLAVVREALVLAWHTTAAVSHSPTPAAELDWMHLAEVLFTASGDMSELDGQPQPGAFGDTPPGAGMLPDSPQLRQGVARLLRTTAGALRTLAAEADVHNADAALTMSIVAAALEGAVEAWPWPTDS